MRAGARAEWDPLHRVMVHEPGMEVFFALLAPSAHLYERYFSLRKAQAEHRMLCDLLNREYGVGIDRLVPTLVQGAAGNPKIRESLEATAATRMECRYRYPAPTLPASLRDVCHSVGLADRDPLDLVSIILMDPRLTVDPDGVRTSLNTPYHNLYFLRDQQATLPGGMLRGRMATPERSGEPWLTGMALHSLGAVQVGVIGNGSFEGGDFLPMGDTALVGCGSRTSMSGVHTFLAQRPGFDEVAVVHQPDHPLLQGRDPMVAMHIDTYLNIPGEGVAVGCPILLDRARVEVFTHDGGEYVHDPWTGTLSQYLDRKGYEIIGISTLEQLCYAANFLTVRDREIVAVDTARLAPVVLRRLRESVARRPGVYDLLLAQAEQDYARLRADAEFFPASQEVYAHGLEVSPVTVTNATGGYGGPHCMTCVLRRG
ncbi:MAG: arginine deiminase family protein [Methanomicrobiales archaeon]